MDAAAGVNDLQFEDIDIPATDIYTQEFFFYAYSFITKDRKPQNFIDSNEGFTYIKQ